MLQLLSAQPKETKAIVLLSLSLTFTLPVNGSTNQTLAITGITISNKVPQLTIQSPTGISNLIQYTTNLNPANWTLLTNLLVAQSPYRVADTTAPGAQKRFYRVAEPLVIVTLKQLWGGTGDPERAGAPIQASSTPSPVNTSSSFFDAGHTTIWIPISFMPAWTANTPLFFGNSFGKMKLLALGVGQIQCQTLSGYFSWPAGTPITTTTDYIISNVMTAASNWTTPGMGNTVVVGASAVSANVGDIVWAGAVGQDQFQVVSIHR